MFINIHLYFISKIFLFLSWFLKKSKIGNGYTLPGFLLQKLPIDYLSLYFKHLDSKFIFITGTNGKTSTTAMLNQILLDSGYTTLSNLSGSNLKRGILSTLALEFNKFSKHSPNFCIFEVDEASVSGVLASFPHEKKFNLLVLNLSRDQLDRYGEVDILISKINDSLRSFKNYNLFLKKDNYTNSFKKPYFLVKGESKDFVNACSKLKINQVPHLKNNFSFIFNLLSLLNVPIKYSNLSVFNYVSGRGSKYFYGKTKITLNLTKNPASFNANLGEIPVDCENILIYMNDQIPDGHDVSWFYDIDYSLLCSMLKNKNVYLCGTRAYDFYNMLNVLGIPAFNFIDFKKSLIYCKSWNLKDFYILANYSAMVNVLKIL